MTQYVIDDQKNVMMAFISFGIISSVFNFFAIFVNLRSSRKKLLRFANVLLYIQLANSAGSLLYCVFGIQLKLPPYGYLYIGIFQVAFNINGFIQYHMNSIVYLATCTCCLKCIVQVHQNVLPPTSKIKFSERTSQYFWIGILFLLLLIKAHDVFNYYDLVNNLDESRFDEDEFFNLSQVSSYSNTYPMGRNIQLPIVYFYCVCVMALVLVIHITYLLVTMCPKNRDKRRRQREAVYAVYGLTMPALAGTLLYHSIVRILTSYLANTQLLVYMTIGTHAHLPVTSMAVIFVISEFRKTAADIFFCRSSVKNDPKLSQIVSVVAR